MHTTIVICSRWQAKIAFMIGIYSWAESVDELTETRRMRDWSEFPDGLSLVFIPEEAPVPDASSNLEEPPCASFHVIVRRLMWLSSSVRAPAIIVDVVELTSDAGVVSRSFRILQVTCSSIIRKGRYLFA